MFLPKHGDYVSHFPSENLPGMLILGYCHTQPWISGLLGAPCWHRSWYPWTSCQTFWRIFGTIQSPFQQPADCSWCFAYRLDHIKPTLCCWYDESVLSRFVISDSMFAWLIITTVHFSEANRHFSFGKFTCLLVKRPCLSLETLLHSPPTNIDPAK